MILELQMMIKISSKKKRKNKKRLANIAKRHITDFTKNYDQDFAEVLGLPEITADDLFKNNREKEPVVIDALRQQARFIKIEEGYPHFLTESKNAKKLVKFGLDSPDTPILDFYEGLTWVSKIYSILDIVYDECIDIHKPDNGFARSALQGAIALLAITKLKLAKMNQKDTKSPDDETWFNLEDGYVFDYPDKMMFLAKEAKSFASPEKAEYLDPAIAGHLNLETIEYFEFIDRSEIDDDMLNDNLDIDALIKKSI
jgi:hypothetical protein